MAHHVLVAAYFRGPHACSTASGFARPGAQIWRPSAQPAARRAQPLGDLLISPPPRNLLPHDAFAMCHNLRPRPPSGEPGLRAQSVVHRPSSPGLQLQLHDSTASTHTHHGAQGRKREEGVWPREEGRERGESPLLCSALTWKPSGDSSSASCCSFGLLRRGRTSSRSLPLCHLN